MACEVTVLLISGDDLDGRLKQLYAEDWYVRQLFQEAGGYRVFCQRKIVGTVSPQQSRRVSLRAKEEAKANEILLAYPQRSCRSLVALLAEQGIKRSPSWVSDQRRKLRNQ